jgi:antirestriction protein ArdC
MQNIYDRITNQIIEALEKGVRPWARPWKAGRGGSIATPLRHNGVPYRGINTLVLWLTADREGFQSPYWMTFNQVKQYGGFVKPGSKGTHIVYWGTAGGEEEEAEDGTTTKRGGFWFVRDYCVFNLDQTEGLEERFGVQPDANPEQTQFEHLAHAEQFFKNTGADVRHGGDQAFYRPSADFIQMPNPENFKDRTAYYGTLAHEVTHWTGAETRLNRSIKNLFGNPEYAAEELVAEMGAAFTCAHLGIENEPRADHASYLGHWLKCLKADNKAIFTAASAAQKAVDLMVKLQPGGTVPTAEPEATRPKAKRTRKSRTKVAKVA